MSSQNDIAPFYCGDSRVYTFRLRDKDLNPVSVDGGRLTVTFKSRKELPDSEAEIQKAVDTVEADPAFPTGEMQIALSKDDTRVPPGTYYYDFQYEDASGGCTTLLPKPGVGSGKVKLFDDVTKTVR